MAKLASAISGSLTMLDFIGNYAECQDFNPGDRLFLGRSVSHRTA